MKIPNPCLLLLLGLCGCASHPDRLPHPEARSPLVPGAMYSPVQNPPEGFLSVFLLGNVEHPGAYRLPPGANLHDLLMRAGDFGGQGDFGGKPWHTLKLTRNDPEPKVYNIRFRGEGAADPSTFPLLDGDVVLIPTVIF